ncbi:MAG: phospholipid carrier-dependent glycosyltransferase, partial [Crenarchaeota archaeon]|nr:phospholipid carrier-dependent glycosyltransferase [Thermoproteota archaeon]
MKIPNFGLNKKDLVTISALCLIFLSMAITELGNTQIPQTITNISNGQSFIIDLGSEQDISKVYLLLKNGYMNVTGYIGTSENWQKVASNICQPYNTNNRDWSVDYYKYHSINVIGNSRYIKLEFGYAFSSAEFAEVVITNSDNQQLTISTISSDIEIANLTYLYDEQALINLPLTYLDQTYFDEIYFARTAEQYLNLQSPYEWTHPPLGKLIQATGITIFGLTPFGWRIMGVLFATLMIPIMYLIGKRLFGTWIGAFTPSFLITFDFMHFTMGRMGTADTYVVFFAILSQLFFLIYFQQVTKKGWK